MFELNDRIEIDRSISYFYTLELKHTRFFWISDTDCGNGNNARYDYKHNKYIRRHSWTGFLPTPIFSTTEDYSPGMKTKSRKEYTRVLNALANSSIGSLNYRSFLDWVVREYRHG